MAGKYTPLEKYLRDLPDSQREVTLRFEQIERILKDKLPSSAYEDRRWWECEKEGNHCVEEPPSGGFVGIAPTFTSGAGRKAE
jgi:hypothetical protein